MISSLNRKCHNALNEYLNMQNVFVRLTKPDCPDYDGILIPIAHHDRVESLLEVINKMWPDACYDTVGALTLREAVALPNFMTLKEWVGINCMLPEFLVPHPIVYQVSLASNY